MKLIICYAASLLLLAGCTKNEQAFYNDQPTIYFAGDQDISFTFTKYKENQVTVLIPVEIGGYSTGADRSFDVEVVADSTSAVAGLHYQEFSHTLVIPADSFKVHIPLTFLNTDPALKTEKVRLYLRLQPNENFASGIFDRQTLDIEISDILVKPPLWNSIYSGFFGVYSQVKHRKILEICNIPEIPDEYDGGAYNYKWDAYGRAVNNYFRDNYPQYDENNQVIEPWM